MSFTVICNSVFSYDSANTNNSNRQYNFDFSKFDDGPYKLTFQFTSVGTTTNNIYFIAIPDFGACLNSYSAGASTTATFNNFLGLISNWNATVATGYLTNLQNLPKFVSNKPRASTFSVLIADINGAAIALPVDYILILNFEKM